MVWGRNVCGRPYRSTLINLYTVLHDRNVHECADELERANRKKKKLNTHYTQSKTTYM